jgi:hypothetical protein
MKNTLKAILLIFIMSTCASAQMPAGVNSFGDSITVGTGVTISVGNEYYNWMKGTFGGVDTNYGITATQAADMTNTVYTHILNTSSSPATTMLIGTNDASLAGVGANKEYIFNRALSSAAAWSAIPHTSMVWGQDAGCVKSGTWVADNTFVTGVAEKSTTNGSTLTCTITVGSSGVAYVAYRAIDSNGGTMSVTIDGSTPGNDSTLTATGPGGQCICANGGATQTEFLARYSGLSVASHVFVFTVTSATSASNVNSLIWVGTTFTVTSSTPRVYVGGVIPQQNDTSSAATKEYNLDVSGDIAVLRADGLPIDFVDVRGYINSGNDFNGGSAPGFPAIPSIVTCPASSSNPLHPGDCGHIHIGQAFMYAYTTDGSGGFNHAQTTAFATGSSVNSQAVVLSGPPAVGDVVALSVALITSSTISSIADSNGKAYTISTHSPSNGVVTPYNKVFLAYRIATGGESATITVTPGTNSNVDIYADDFSVSGSAAFFGADITGNGTSASSPTTSPSITPSASGNMLYAGGSITNFAFTGMSGTWTGSVAGSYDAAGYITSSGSGATAVAFAFSGSQTYNAIAMNFTQAAPAATPVISPSAGTYTSPQTITMSCSTPASSIYYTTNGTIPSSGSTLYTGGFSHSIPATVKAICEAAGSGNSSIAENDYALFVAGAYTARTDLTPQAYPGTIPCPSAGGCGSGGNATGQGYCFTPSDFNNLTCRLTDNSAGGSQHSYGADCGGSSEINMFSSDDSLTFACTGGSVPIVLNIPTNLSNGSNAITTRYISQGPNFDGMLGGCAAGSTFITTTPEFSFTQPKIAYVESFNASGNQSICQYDFTSSTTMPTPGNGKVSVLIDLSTCAGSLAGVGYGTYVDDVNVSSDDQTFAVMGSTTAGQGSTGAVWVVVWNRTNGCRVWNTATGAVTGAMGALAYPTGSINITDRFYLHNVRLSKNGHVIKVTQNTCTASPGGCTVNTNTYIWDITGLTVNRIINDGTLGCGHNTIGQVETMNLCGGFQFRPFSSNDASGTDVLSGNYPPNFTEDGHAGFGNGNAADTLPVVWSLYNGQFTPVQAWDNEVIGVRLDGSGVAYRFAHTYATGLAVDFGAQFGIGAVSADGKYWIWSTDWDGMLGTTAPSNSCTIGSNCRDDVFLAVLPLAAGGGGTGTNMPAGVTIKGVTIH